MKVQLESTTKIVTVNGIQARIWEGTTESGIGVHCYVTRIAVRMKDDCTQFEKELLVQRSPSAEVAEIPMRLII